MERVTLISLTNPKRLIVYTLPTVLRRWWGVVGVNTHLLVYAPKGIHISHAKVGVLPHGGPTFNHFSYAITLQG
jgi:hypothetical protein